MLPIFTPTSLSSHPRTLYTIPEPQSPKVLSPKTHFFIYLAHIAPQPNFNHHNKRQTENDFPQCQLYFKFCNELLSSTAYAPLALAGTGANFSQSWLKRAFTSAFERMGPRASQHRIPISHYPNPFLHPPICVHHNTADVHAPKTSIVFGANFHREKFVLLSLYAFDD